MVIGEEAMGVPRRGVDSVVVAVVVRKAGRLGVFIPSRAPYFGVREVGTRQPLGENKGTLVRAPCHVGRIWVTDVSPPGVTP